MRLRLPTSPLPPLLAPRASPAALLDASAVASVHTSLGDVSSTLAFADQAGNLAGALFPLSLPPYLLFLYFLGYEGNRCPKTAQFGAQFLLLFVVSTVLTGIVTKGTYSSSLADVDWLHGGAEALLTTSNLFLGFGLAGARSVAVPVHPAAARASPRTTHSPLIGALSSGKMEPAGAGMEGTRPQRFAALALAVTVFGSAFAGPQLGVEAHSPFLSCRRMRTIN